jgi:hypothetical protein
MVKSVSILRFPPAGRAFISITLVLMAAMASFPKIAFCSEVVLNWSRGQNAAVSGYKIYIGNHSGRYLHSVDVGNRLSYRIQDLQEDTTYYFAATAYVTGRADIQNVYDAEKESRVIALRGAGLDHGYRLPTPGPVISGPFVVAWHMKYAEPFEVFIDVDTNEGHRYLAYPPVDVNSLGSGEFVRHGIGSHLTDGRWHAVIRDLQEDLAAAQPGVRITAVNSFMIRGSGYLDDIRLLPSAPGSDGALVMEDAEDRQTDGWHLFLDFAGEFITAESDFSNEVAAYIPLRDTDNDGLPDRAEKIDYGTDPLLPDTDGDGSIDGIEIHWGTNPIDRTSFPEPNGMTSTYEDGGGARNWGIYLDFTNRSSAPEVTTVYDAVRESSVVQFDGAGIDHGYRLNAERLGNWHNTEHSIIQWSMNYIEDFEIFVDVETRAGHRYLTYSPVDHHGLGAGEFVRHGIGSNAADGSWRTYVRDLQADLEKAQPGVSITAVNGFLIRGSGRIDDIKLHRRLL